MPLPQHHHAQQLAAYSSRAMRAAMPKVAATPTGVAELPADLAAATALVARVVVSTGV